MQQQYMLCSAHYMCFGLQQRMAPAGDAAFYAVVSNNAATHPSSLSTGEPCQCGQWL